jgi:serine O-acetyltransferase
MRIIENNKQLRAKLMKTRRNIKNSLKTLQKIKDPIWCNLGKEAAEAAQKEPILASYFHASILKHNSLDEALMLHLANKLSDDCIPSILIHEIITEAFLLRSAFCQEMRADLQAIRDRDPASHGYLTPFLHFKGFHALQSYRVANCLWDKGRHALACYLQNRISEKFGVDVHPAAIIGKGILIDHATSVVIGETAVIEDNVSMLHEVTLGGTGKSEGDRHPKIRRGVLIGAGAKILGNIEIGEGSKVAAGSVVLSDVPPKCTVAGVPAKIVGKTGVNAPALEMDHLLKNAEIAQ